MHIPKSRCHAQGYCFCLCLFPILAMFSVLIALFLFFACTHVIESELAAVLRHTKLPLIRGWSSTQRLMIHRSGASPNLVQISSARHLLGLVMKQNHNPSDLGRSIQVGPRRLHSKTRRPRPFPRPGRGLCPTLGWRRSSGP